VTNATEIICLQPFDGVRHWFYGTTSETTTTLFSGWPVTTLRPSYAMRSDIISWSRFPPTWFLACTVYVVRRNHTTSAANRGSWVWVLYSNIMYRWADKAEVLEVHSVGVPRHAPGVQANYSPAIDRHWCLSPPTHAFLTNKIIHTYNPIRVLLKYILVTTGPPLYYI